MNIEAYNWLPPEVLDVLDMLPEVHKSLLNSINIFLAQLFLFNASVVLQSLDGGNYDHRCNWQSRLPAKNIKELFRTQVCAKTCFCDIEIRNVKAKIGCNQRGSSMGDVCKRPAMNNSRVTFNCLDQVWLYGIFQQHSHWTGCIQVPAINRVTVHSKAYKCIAQHFLELAGVLAQAKNGHYLRCRSNVKMFFVYHSTLPASEAHNNISK